MKLLQIIFQYRIGRSFNHQIQDHSEERGSHKISKHYVYEPCWLHKPELLHVDYCEDYVDVVDQIDA